MAEVSTPAERPAGAAVAGDRRLPDRRAGLRERSWWSATSARTQRPVLAWPVLAVMAAWTVLTTYAYADPARRRPPLLVADLLDHHGRAGRQRLGGRPRRRWRTGRPTLAVAWHVAPVIAWAVAGGRRGGIVAALAMGATDLAVRAHYDQAAFTGTVLMLLAALAVGYLVRLAEVAAGAAATGDRAGGGHPGTGTAGPRHPRLGAAGARPGPAARRRAGRRGRRTGPAGRRAGGGAAGAGHRAAAPAPSTSAEVDLMTLLGAVRLDHGLGRRAGRRGAAARPAGRGRSPRRSSAALDNVAEHCAPGTKAWVLVEDEAGAGDGQRARRRLRHRRRTGSPRPSAQGRLGVAQSIRGRIADLRRHGADHLRARARAPRWRWSIPAYADIVNAVGDASRCGSWWSTTTRCGGRAWAAT